MVSVFQVFVAKITSTLFETQLKHVTPGAQRGQQVLRADDVKIL